MDTERSKGKRKEYKRIKEGLELDLVIKSKPHCQKGDCTREGFVAKNGHKERVRRMIVCGSG